MKGTAENEKLDELYAREKKITIKTYDKLMENEDSFYLKVH